MVLILRYWTTSESNKFPFRRLTVKPPKRKFAIQHGIAHILRHASIVDSNSAFRQVSILTCSLSQLPPPVFHEFLSMGIELPEIVDFPLFPVICDLSSLIHTTQTLSIWSLRCVCQFLHGMTFSLTVIPQRSSAMVAVWSKAIAGSCQSAESRLLEH